MGYPYNYKELQLLFHYKCTDIVTFSYVALFYVTLLFSQEKRFSRIVERVELAETVKSRSPDYEHHKTTVHNWQDQRLKDPIVIS